MLGLMQFRFPEENRFPPWKISLLQYVMAAVFGVLLIGYWRLQVAEHGTYVEAAERNRIRALPIIAPRGRILDRQGRVLADNFPAFKILLRRDNPAIFQPSVIRDIALGLGLDPSALAAMIKAASRLPRFQPIVIKPSATLGDVAFVESHHLEYPELDTIQASQRLYPAHQLAAQVLGYVGEVSESEIAKPGSRYRPGDVVGKSGIEEEYNSLLMGQDGMQRLIVNSRGQEVGRLKSINAIPGHDIRLTLDLDLQMAAEKALGGQPGAVVVLNPQNGQVLAMVSHPAFDPNDFARHIDAAEWQQLVSNPQKPMMNKAIQAQLAPGSVFKIIVATAALETRTITPQFTIDSRGEEVIYGHVFHDWTFWTNHPGHGYISLHRAIVESCDDYFYIVGKMLGIRNIDYYARHLGLGQRTGIDLPGEEPGLVPSPAWVERVYKHPWWPGETISVAIGQGALMVTPLQLAYALGGIASGGVFHRPHLAFRNELNSFDIDPPINTTITFPLRPQTVNVVTKGMWGVVNESDGTGVGARSPGLDIGGKTGTAQVASEGTAMTDRARYRDNAWFVGLSPSFEPQIAVAVLVVGGRESSVAAPIAGQIIKAYYAERQGGPPPAAQKRAQVSREGPPGQVFDLKHPAMPR
jgi:penicillin-binding protein 2